MEKYEYSFWEEYPRRDPQAVVWYPCRFSTVDTSEVWSTNNNTDKEIGFYIHIPFCKGVCQYCPFNKYQWSSEQANQFVNILKKEITQLTKNNYFINKTIAAGYFGGGTPTSLSFEQIEEILTCCKDNLNFKEGMELTIEATPDSVDYKTLERLRNIGFNRISFGIQSFNKKLLRNMGRSHISQKSVEAVNIAKSVGFDVVSIDLMYRIPGQTMLDWVEDLNNAVLLDVDHITTFSMFIDPGTKLYELASDKKEMLQPNEKSEEEMYKTAINLLEKSGYYLYTLYDFAKSGKECIHHSINWQAPQMDYVGFGPGAFSYINNNTNAFIYCNISDLKSYIEVVDQGINPVEFGKRLTLEDRMSRYMVLGFNYLRVAKEPFYTEFGRTIEEIYKKQIDKLKGWNVIDEDDRYYYLNSKGKWYLANVSKLFYTEENKYTPHVIGVELQKGEGLSLGGIEKNSYIQ